METINTIELKDPNVYPDEAVLKGILGESYPAYVELLNLYEANQMTTEWRYYFDGKAWLCKVQKKKKTMVWMSAWKGYMQATIYVPEKHSDAIFSLAISEELKERFRETRKVGKSLPCIFKIHNTEILKEFEIVLHTKENLK
jgi:hypothetical protein